MVFLKNTSSTGHELWSICCEAVFQTREGCERAL